jgi:hypothetical protein
MELKVIFKDCITQVLSMGKRIVNTKKKDHNKFHTCNPIVNILSIIEIIIEC